MRSALCSLRRLFELDGGASALKLLFDFAGLILGGVFLDRFRRTLDQVLGFFQAKTGDRAHFLDHVDLLRCAEAGQNDT